jgi:hypothetical protein
MGTYKVGELDERDLVYAFDPSNQPKHNEMLARIWVSLFVELGIIDNSIQKRKREKMGRKNRDTDREGRRERDRELRWGGIFFTPPTNHNEMLARIWISLFVELRIIENSI